MHADGIVEELVEILGPRGQQVGHPLHAPRRTGDIDVGRREFTRRPAGEEVDADGAHQGFGEPVLDERGLGGTRPACGHHGGRRPDAGGEVPGVVFRAFCTHLAHLTLS
jgi:hypothetical protein